jgi:glycosyltransferase involved in cell wall biosynthesis
MSAIRVMRIIARMNVGGPALQVTALADGLDPERFEQRLLVGHVDEGEADYLTLRAPQVEAVRVAGLGRSPDPTGDARALATITRQIRDFRPDIVHTHTAKAGVLGRSAAILGGAKTRVHTFHGHLLHGYFSPRVTRAVVEVERAYARRTTRLVAVGRQVRDELLAAKIGRPEQYAIVPPGVQLPTPPARGAARSMLGVPVDAPTVAFVARLTQVKRPDRFADVARLVADAVPDAHFVVAGEGDLLEDLRTRLAPLGDRAHLVGFRSDVETIYAAADVTVLTSDNEGMPVSLIEAATIGCPAVTTDVGSAGEVVLDGETGYVTAVDAAALADATVTILRDPALRERFSKAATAHAHAAFSASRLVGDIAELYESIVPARPGTAVSA